MMMFVKALDPTTSAKEVTRFPRAFVGADVRLDCFVQAFKVDFDLAVAGRRHLAAWPEALRRKEVETVVDIEMVLPKVGGVYREDQSVLAHCTLIHTRIDVVPRRFTDRVRGAAVVVTCSLRKM